MAPHRVRYHWSLGFFAAAAIAVAAWFAMSAAIAQEYRDKGFPLTATVLSTREVKHTRGSGWVFDLRYEHEGTRQATVECPTSDRCPVPGHEIRIWVDPRDPNFFVDEEDRYPGDAPGVAVLALIIAFCFGIAGVGAFIAGFRVHE